MATCSVPTSKQDTGRLGEKHVTQRCECPRCKRKRTLRRLPTNFKCADVVCDFCVYLDQVKTANVPDPMKLPSTILGAAWGVQSARMSAGIYFPLFLVLIDKQRRFAIYYLPADLQHRNFFKPRRPLSKNARRAGWRGITYDLRAVPKGAIVRIYR